MKKNQLQFEPVFFKTRANKSLKKLFITSFLCLTFSFFSFKWYYQSHYYQSHYNLFEKFNKSPKKAIQKLSSQKGHNLPLLVSLKGNEGPLLARVIVSLYLDPEKKTFDKEFESLKKQLLFLLSGQSIAQLNNKDFQDQIQNQLNFFLSPQVIQNLNIKTELLNSTRSSL